MSDARDSGPEVIISLQGFAAMCLSYKDSGMPGKDMQMLADKYRDAAFCVSMAAKECARLRARIAELEAEIEAGKDKFAWLNTMLLRVGDAVGIETISDDFPYKIKAHIAELEAAATRENNLRARLDVIHGHATEILREISKGGKEAENKNGVPIVTDELVEIGSEAYAKATGYYVPFHRGLLSESSNKIRQGIRAALTAALAVAGDGWEPIETAEMNNKVLLGWYDSTGEWNCEVGCASWGWRNAEANNVSRHSHATHCHPLPLPPAPKEG